MDNKGFVFTTDLLLAFIVITLAVGMTISQYEGLNFQLQDFTGRQSLEKTVNDAADYLVKNTGTPKNWERSISSLDPSYLPGLAAVDKASTPDGALYNNVFAISNYLDNKKIVGIKHLQDNGNFPVSKLVNTNNYYLRIVGLQNNPVNYLELGQNPNTLNPSPKEIAVANRTVSLIPGDILLQMTDLAHLNPSEPGDSPYLWYWKANNQGKGGGRPAIYVGPTMNKPSVDPDNASVYITQQDLIDFDFYIRVDVNQGGGSGVSSADYGFTDADWVVNGSYGNPTKYMGYDPTSPLHNITDDDNREAAIQEELMYINGNSNQGFIKINNQDLDTGSFVKVDDVLNATLTKRGDPNMKLWFRVPSDVNADFSISLVRTRQDQSLDKVPAQLILMIWE